MVEAENITKKIGKKQILHTMNLSIATGEFVTVLGPNGAGKSTLLKILSLLMPPSTGRLIIAGRPVEKDGLYQLRERIGFVSHQTFLYENLSAEENLQFYGEMYGVGRLSARIGQVLEEVGLTYCFRDPVRTFSRGMLQRLSIARAILHNPSVMFFDEPYTGLDQEAIDILNSVLQRLAHHKRTVFLVTHNYEQGLALSNRTLIICGGRLVYDKSGLQLTASAFRDVYRQEVGRTSSGLFKEELYHL